MNSIIPKPASLTTEQGQFLLNDKTKIVCDVDNKVNAEYLMRQMPLKVCYCNGTAKENEKNIIKLELKSSLSCLGNEGYLLHITQDAILIQASHQKGVFYGIQTLLQLTGTKKSLMAGITTGIELNCVRIEDKPCFKWRGLLLDSCRYFIPVEFIKKYIDMLSRHKLNVFHWHLTDDQGWRIEIKKYPRLCEIGAWRDSTLIGHMETKPHRFDMNRHGGFYTQNEIKEIVQYARERYVEILPEIEMPGHASAALAAYPEMSCSGEPWKVRNIWGISDHIYCAGNDDALLFNESILHEIVQLFPYEYVHIGGDEVPKSKWHNCPKCQQRIRQEGLKNEQGLHSFFTKKMQKVLQSCKKKTVIWDDAFASDPDMEVTVMSWRNEEDGIMAAKTGHDVIIANNEYYYLDYYQGDPAKEPLAISGHTTLKRVYDYNPVRTISSPNEFKHVLGIQGFVWTEYMKTCDHIEYMTWPRACAIAESAWSGFENKDYEEFECRIRKHICNLDDYGINYRPLDAI
jgi:hexosaminidase